MIKQKEKLIKVNPTHQNSNITDHFYQSQSGSQIAESSPLDDEDDRRFELPDESLIELDDEIRFRAGEMLINPEILLESEYYFLPELLDMIDNFKNHSELFKKYRYKFKPLHEYVFSSLDLCDFEFKNNLGSNILMTGGVSQTRGLFSQFKYVSIFIQIIIVE